MNKSDKNITFDCLVERVEQHEQLITQLVEIIGATNRNMKEMLVHQKRSLTTKDVQLLISPNKLNHFH